MIILIVSLLGLQTVCLLSAFVLLPRYVARIRRDLSEQARDFVASPADGSPSPLAIIADQFATLLAGRIWQQIESRIRATSSDMSKEATADLTAGLSAKSPLAALAMAFLPKRARNMLAKNPQFLGQLSMLGSQPQTGSNGGGSVANRIKNNRG